MNYKIVALMGASGAGKDTVLGALMTQAPHFHEIISCTTRPPREGEVDGINYHFLTHDDFAEQINQGKMMEVTIFRGWCYGTSFDNLVSDKINIGVFNPSGVAMLMDSDNIDVFPIWIQASDKTRLLRQLNREHDPDVKEIIRRFTTDEEDFSDIDIKDGLGYKAYYKSYPITIVNNENQTPEETAKKILDLVSLWAKMDN